MIQEEALVKRATGGDTAAFGQLVAAYQNYVFTITFKVLQKREEAEEAAQDTFLKAWKTLSSFKGTSKFSTWIYSIATHTAIDYLRRRKLETDSLDRDDAFFHMADTGAHSAQERLEEQERCTRIDQALARLPEQDNLLVSLFYLHEKSVEEISQISGLSVSNVKVRLFRARSRLRELMSSP